MTIAGRSDLKTNIGDNFNAGNVSGISTRPKIIIAGLEAGDTTGVFTSGTLNLKNEVYSEIPTNFSLITEKYTITAEFTIHGQTTEVMTKSILYEIRRALEVLTRDITHSYDYEMRTTNYMYYDGTISIDLIFEMWKELVNKTDAYS